MSCLLHWLEENSLPDKCLPAGIFGWQLKNLRTINAHKIFSTQQAALSIFHSKIGRNTFDNKYAVIGGNWLLVYVFLHVILVEV